MFREKKPAGVRKDGELARFSLLRWSVRSMSTLFEHLIKRACYMPFKVFSNGDLANIPEEKSVLYSEKI